ncbi:MAG: hypothetical protein OXH57_10985 [Ekhidna sp.]|nr:hypothetical protein [Ekhidna sp.]
MQRKLNEDFIDSYCGKFAVKVSSNFFKNGNKVITGRQILNVTPSKQVNFFVIKLLFRYWQEETKKLESPFFNYKHKEVRQAILQFMNVLSRHIEIERERFELLLNHAIKDTIYLAAMPQAYIEIDLDSRGVDEVHDKAIEGTVKYLKIHKKEIFNFLSDMKGLSIDHVIDELPDEFDDFDITEAVEELCELLTPILEISMEKIFSEDLDIDDFDEDDLFEYGEEDLVGVALRPGRTPLESADKEPGVEDDMIIKEGMEEDPIGRLPSGGKRKKKGISKQPSSEQKHTGDDTQNKDQEETTGLKPEKEGQSLVEHHDPQTKFNGIMKLISLNHRYMFIRELFRNDKSNFEQALEELEEYDSFDESVEFLVQTYAKHNEWDMQSDEVKEFLKVLFRRFR